MRMMNEMLIATRGEMPPDASSIVQHVSSLSAAHRLLARFRYRMTPQAARVVALRPAAGTLDNLAALIFARQLVLFVRREERPIAAATIRRKVPYVPPVEPVIAARKATSWIGFRVVHHATGEPFVGVRLVVRTPDGMEASCRTNAAGLASLDDIAPGVCDVWCSLKDARLALTVAFVGMGEPAPREASAADRTRMDWGAPAEWIAHVHEHRVQTGESLKSIAEKYAYTWQDLANFNWGTSIPHEINQRLRDEVGCTRKTPDGMNYEFTSEDSPGLIYIPRPWAQNGLATEQTHVFRVRIAGGFRLILENMDGLRIPEAEYEATLSDGAVHRGHLGRNGLALIKDPPPGPVDVRYLDLDDIEAKSLAATVRKAFDDRQPLEIHRLFRYPAETVQRTFDAYDRYYNDYHGQGLRNDLEQEFFSDEDAELIFFGYMSEADMPWSHQPGAAAAPAEEPARG